MLDIFYRALHEENKYLKKKMLKLLLIGLARLFTPCHAVSGDIRGPYKRNNSVPSIFEYGIILYVLKFVFSKKATKIDEIFIFDLTVCSKCQIDVEDFINFRGLLRKHEL